jgi:hypothetical protein
VGRASAPDQCCRTHGAAGWFTTLDANLLIATTGTDWRVDLLVVAPAASAASAAAAAAMATEGAPTLRAADIAAAVSAPNQSHGQPPAEDVWESDGGRVDGHRAGSNMPETAPVS